GGRAARPQTGGLAGDHAGNHPAPLPDPAALGVSQAGAHDGGGVERALLCCFAGFLFCKGSLTLCTPVCWQCGIRGCGGEPVCTLGLEPVNGPGPPPPCT